MPRLARALLSLLALTCALASSAYATWPVGGVRLPFAPLDQWGLVPDGAGGALALYQNVYTQNWLRSFHVLADGSWDPADGDTGRIAVQYPYGEHAVQPVTDDAGGVLLSFIRCGPFTAHTQCWENGRNWLQHSAAGAAVPDWPDSGVDLGPSTSPASPQLVSDAAGGAIVRLGTCVNRWTAAGAVPWTPDAGQPGVRFTTVASPVISPLPAPDGAGGAWVAWADEVFPGVSSLRRIRLNHISASGQRLLGSGGRTLVTDYNLRPSAIASDGAGGVFVAWCSPAFDGGVAVDSVFVQHVDATGSNLWDFAGSPAGNVYPGSACPMWRSGEDEVVLLLRAGLGPGRVQKLSSGAPGWANAPEGVWPNVQGVLSAGPLVIPGEDGSVFLAWSDFHDGVRQPRITLLDASGAAAPGWTLSGTALSNASNDESVNALVPGANPGEVIVGWMRPDPVYVGLGNQILRKVVSAGVLAVPPSPPSLALAAPWPNPARDGWTVSFSLPAPGEAMVELFDVAGRRLRGERVVARSAGPRQVRLDARDLAPGVYRVRLRAAAGERTRPLLLLR